MKELENRFARIGVKIPEILLPRDVDMTKWAVIACDQFTSEKAYWEDTKNIAGDSPSTLNLILPECYLGEEELDNQVASIHKKMEEYLETGVLVKQSPGFVLVERSTEFTPLKRGIVLAVDLECYDFSKDSESLIRPTEGTIIERLPPRIKIRQNAALDLPHILILIDDPDGLVIERAAAKRDQMELLYDFELMQGGGHVSGRKIDNPEILGGILEGLEELAKNRNLLFAMGDGNHSLAAAKSIWEETKKNGGPEVMEHPSRWALVEVENIYDEGLRFEPIHRVLFGTGLTTFIGFLQVKSYGSFEYVSDLERIKEELASPQKSVESSGGHRIGMVSGDSFGILTLDAPGTSLTAEALQSVLDEFLQNLDTVKIDYIHGVDTLIELGKDPGNISFYLPRLDKAIFFDTIIKRGSFPRKTFSIGEATEKRYYLESRKLLP